MKRQWSDGIHEDSTREAELRMEFEQRVRIDALVADLKCLNDWLRLQITEPWRIENYRQKERSRPQQRAVTA